MLVNVTILVRLQITDAQYYPRYKAPVGQQQANHICVDYVLANINPTNVAIRDAATTFVASATNVIKHDRDDPFLT